MIASEFFLDKALDKMKGWPREGQPSLMHLPFPQKMFTQNHNENQTKE